MLIIKEINNKQLYCIQIVSKQIENKEYAIKFDPNIDFSAVHTMLNDLLPDHIYFRFNPYLTEMQSMVEIRPEKISLMEQDARMYIRRNEEKFQKAATVLLEKRRIQQKIADYITLQRQLLNL